MKTLSSPIVITTTLQLYQYVFEEFDQKPARLKFKCVCENFNTFDLHYGTKAFLFNDLYKISKTSINYLFKKQYIIILISFSSFFTQISSEIICPFYSLFLHLQ